MNQSDFAYLLQWYNNIGQCYTLIKIKDFLSFFISQETRRLLLPREN